jgi:hypothetical protein
MENREVRAMRSTAIPALPEQPTGADLVEAVRQHAERTGLLPTQVFAKLSGHPGRWVRQVSAAQKPMPHTVERVRALLAGEPLPQQPASPFGKRNGRGGKSAEAEILRRLDEGQPRQRILEETGFHPTIVDKTTNLGSEAGTVAMNADLRNGSAGLLKAVFAESAAAERRRNAALSTGTVVSALDHLGPQPVARFVPTASDRRRFAVSREPCPRCNTRGDLGCRHQRPYEPREASQC